MEEKDCPISQEQQEYEERHTEKTFIVILVSLFVFCFSSVIFLYYGHHIFFAIMAILAYLGLIIPLPNQYNKADYSTRLLVRIAVVGGITMGAVSVYVMWLFLKVMTIIFSHGR